MAPPRFANVLRTESGLQYASTGSFRKNPLRIADMSHHVAIPDSGNAILYGQPYPTTWGWLYPGTVRGLSTPTPPRARVTKFNGLLQECLWKKLKFIDLVGS